MAGQSIGRREILRILSVAATAAAFPGFSRWSFACGHVRPSIARIRPSVYRPIFFSGFEYATIERLVDLIIPSDGTPGAREAGVAEFIDLMASRDTQLQHTLRYGLRWLNTRSNKTEGKAFSKLHPVRQSALLEPLAYKAKFRSGEERARDFFDLLREYTVMGFYTSEVGLKELDFPGLRFYSESPACPHVDDPEHRRLQVPTS